MAKAKNKMAFIHLENNRCGQCNEVASMAFGSVSLKDKLGKNFISVRTKIESVEGQILASRFDIRSTPTTLYVSFGRDILSRYNGSNSNPEEYSLDDLLEQYYVAVLPKDSWEDLKNLEFIYCSGPAIDSLVYNFTIHTFILRAVSIYCQGS